MNSTVFAVVKRLVEQHGSTEVTEALARVFEDNVAEIDAQPEAQRDAWHSRFNRAAFADQAARFRELTAVIGRYR